MKHLRNFEKHRNSKKQNVEVSKTNESVLQVNDIKVTNSINKLENINKIRNQIETIIVKRKNEHLRFSLQ